MLPPLARTAAEPRGARRSAVTARRRAAAARGDSAADEAAAGFRRHGRAADADVSARPLRSGSRRQLAAGELPESGQAHRADGEPGRDLRPDQGRRRPDPTGSGAGARGKLPLHADGQPAERAGDAGVRRRARAARGPRTERVDVRGARGGGDPHRSPLRHRRGHRRAEGAAPWRRERRRDAAADRNRSRMRRRSVSTRPSRASSRRR